jgi:N-(2-amino-2-carboxyethyl)-L-glutamate synthase
MIYSRVQDIVLDDILLNLPGFIPGVELFLKIEGLNPAGSIKIKTAVGLIDSLESAGSITPGTRIIESSSGNLGIALAMVCAQKGYLLTIVTDPNVSSQAEKVMRAFGAEIVKVTDRDASGGYLQTRIEYIRDQMSRNPDLLWTNQYASKANIAAHRDRTAERLHKEIGSPDVLVAAVGTSGTLMGCLEYFSFHDHQMRIIAVDSEGSVTFGGAPALRLIPGAGASMRPEIFRDDGTFEKVVVAERDTVRTCRRIAQEYGLLIGGSTGTALAGAHQIKESFAPGDRVIVISADLGGNYTDTVYSDSWVAEHFPEVNT